jgi:hypothetical protein
MSYIQSQSQPQPISRQYLQELKVNNDEQKRLNMINKCVNNIYNSLINQAASSTLTSYNYQINQGPSTDSEFIKKNKNDILNGLKVLFPDCLVEFKILSRGIDGEMYDVSNIDEKISPFINRQNDREYIVIDWT